MTDTITVLLIEDSEADAGLIKAHLASRKNPTFKLHHETTREAGIARLKDVVVDVVVLDLSLPDSSGLDTFLAVREAVDGVPVVILSGLSDEAIALEAVRQGAQDFFSKNEAISVSLGRLLQYTIERFHRQQAQREIDSAAFIQQRLYPRPMPPLPGYDVAGRCDPASEVGGDYFDYFMPDEESLMLVIGDVSGHGFGPSLVMAQTRAALRTMAATTTDVGTMIYQANQLLYEAELGTFVSLFLTRISVPTGACHYATAGQPAELFKAAGPTQTLESADPPLGVRVGVPFEVREIQLQPDDTLLLYTDGLSERSPGLPELFGVARMRELIAGCNQPAEQTVQRLFDHANDFANGRAQVDDMTAIVLRVIATTV